MKVDSCPPNISPTQQNLSHQEDPNRQISQDDHQETLISNFKEEGENLVGCGNQSIENTAKTSETTTPTSTTSNGDEQNNRLNDHLSPPSSPISPKVTVILPKHAATRLRELVQNKDILLMKLGISSVQFENDQIINLPSNLAQSNLEQQAPEPQISLTNNGTDPDFDEDLDKDEENENEVANEVENQHSSSGSGIGYNIHQLSQLDFSDHNHPIDMENMFGNNNDTDNISLFPDYTLNLS